MAHIIVVGNEKGGSGKSTTCMHVATALARMGHRVGALDLDLRQKTFGRYVENRRAWMAKSGITLPSPDYRDLPEGDPATLAQGENAFDQRLTAAVANMDPVKDFIVIDCPGRAQTTVCFAGYRRKGRGARGSAGEKHQDLAVWQGFGGNIGRQATSRVDVAMTRLCTPFVATRGDLAPAWADLTLPATSAETLLKEVRAVDDRAQDTMANRARSDLRDQARTARHTDRLENMQAGLRRLMGGNYGGPIHRCGAAGHCGARCGRRAGAGGGQPGHGRWGR